MAFAVRCSSKKVTSMAAENVPATGSNVVDLAADIVSAYVSNNSVPTGDLPALISAIHTALSNVGNPQAAEAPRGEPAVPIKRSFLEKVEWSGTAPSRPSRQTSDRRG